MRWLGWNVQQTLFQTLLFLIADSWIPACAGMTIGAVSASSPISRDRPYKTAKSRPALVRRPRGAAGIARLRERKRRSREHKSEPHRSHARSSLRLGIHLATNTHRAMWLGEDASRHHFRLRFLDA